jgi:TRAP-type transport system periplasmic protein
MRRMTDRGRLAAVILATATVLAVASCAGGSSGAGSGGASLGADKAGGPGEPVVLRLANTNGDIVLTPTVEYFVQHVGELSGGNLRIEVVDDWGNSASDAERQVVNDVSSGEIDLGWAGTRVFDTLDVTSFQALTAPMLIDSYALENAVIQSGITDEMMQGLDDLGLAGLGVLPDGLRKPMAVTAPLLDPADWRGITFGTLMSRGQSEAIEALGATPAQVNRDEREKSLANGTIQGFETSIWVHHRNAALTTVAPYVTSNVTLWPQMDVLLANPARLEALTLGQRKWLEEAADAAAGRSAALADMDARALRGSCQAGARFAEASDADLAALQVAFAPVLAKFRQDPATEAFIGRIQELKQSTPPEPALSIPADCKGEAPEQPDAGTGNAPAHLNGTYRMVLTQEDADKVGDTDTGYPLVETITLKDGQLKGGCFGKDGGTYVVDDDRITFHSIEFDENATVTFSVDGAGNLHLSPVLPMDPGTAFTCFYKPWTKIG